MALVAIKQFDLVDQIKMTRTAAVWPIFGSNSLNAWTRVWESKQEASLTLSGKFCESRKLSFGDFSAGTLPLRAISMPHFSHTNFYFLSVIFVPKKKTPAWKTFSKWLLQSSLALTRLQTRFFSEAEKYNKKDQNRKVNGWID